MGDVYKVIAPPPVIFLSGLLLGLLLDGVVSDSDLGSWALPVGIALTVFGVALMAWFEISFRRAGTTILPGREGSALVTGGIYRLTRNPGYLGMTLTVSGVALAVLVVDRGVIVKEEAYLRERFGDEYAAYCAQTRRWL